MSVMRAKVDTILPVAYGNEQERGILDDISGKFDEPYMLCEYPESYIPKGMHLVDGFTKNGGLVYADGTEDENGSSSRTNFETATPECSSPGQLVRYMRAADVLLRNVAEGYAVKNSAYGCDINVRLQQRVVDSRGNRKACHDNFGMLPDSMASITEGKNKMLRGQFVWHLATRSFVTGAGLVRPHKLHFAQKIGGLNGVYGYGYGGTMYCITKENGTPRVEVRCSDANISDWASWMRVGSSALVLALLQTPAIDGLGTPDLYPDKTKTIALAGEMNSLKLDEDGQLIERRGDPLIRAIDYQERIADAGMDVLPDYVDDFPDEFFLIARELKRFCEDMRLVLRGGAHFGLLADRADWAAKFIDIQRQIKRDRDFGERRWMNDIRSQARDLRYDYYGISATDGVLRKPVVGSGYKLRDRGFFKKTVPEIEVAEAYHRPPRYTRAYARTELLSKFDASHVSWHQVRIHTDGGKFTIDLPDADDPCLPSPAVRLLKSAKNAKR